MDDAMIIDGNVVEAMDRLERADRDLRLKLSDLPDMPGFRRVRLCLHIGQCLKSIKSAKDVLAECFEEEK